MSQEKEPLTQPILPIKKIRVPDNIRQKGWQKDKELDGLLTSIKQSGLQQPPGVRVLEELGEHGETHELVFGQRRLAACRKLGWTTVPVTLLPKDGGDKQAVIRKLAENFERKDLTPMEEAAAFRQAIDECGFTAHELGKKFGRTDGYVSQKLSILKLPDNVQKAVESGTITQTHARELSRVTNPKKCTALLERSERENLTTPELRDEIKKLAPTERKIAPQGRKPKEARKDEDDEDNDESPKSKSKFPSTPGSVFAYVYETRTTTEVKQQLAMLDEKKNRLPESDKASAAYYDGMIRGISWAKGMIKELLDTDHR